MRKKLKPSSNETSCFKKRESSWVKYSSPGGHPEMGDGLKRIILSKTK